MLTDVRKSLAKIGRQQVAISRTRAESFDFKFNIYVGNYKDCKVYIANIVVFDCGLQYSAYQWRYLFRNAGVDFPTGLKVNKDNNIIYKLKRLIDPLASDGEGDFYILK